MAKKIQELSKRQRSTIVFIECLAVQFGLTSEEVKDIFCDKRWDILERLELCDNESERIEAFNSFTISERGVWFNARDYVKPANFFRFIGIVRLIDLMYCNKSDSYNFDYQDWKDCYSNYLSNAVSGEARHVEANSVDSLAGDVYKGVKLTWQH